MAENAGNNRGRQLARGSGDPGESPRALSAISRGAGTPRNSPRGSQSGKVKTEAVEEEQGAPVTKTLGPRTPMKKEVKIEAQDTVGEGSAKRVARALDQAIITSEVRGGNRSEEVAASNATTTSQKRWIGSSKGGPKRTAQSWRDDPWHQWKGTSSAPKATPTTYNAPVPKSGYGGWNSSGRSAGWTSYGWNSGQGGWKASGGQYKGKMTPTWSSAPTQSQASKDQWRGSTSWNSWDSSWPKNQQGGGTSGVGGRRRRLSWAFARRR